MKKILLSLALCLIFAAIVPDVPADTILFKSGRKVDGTIIASNEQSVTVDLYGVTEMAYELKDIESINGQPIVAPAPEETGMFSPVKPPEPPAAAKDEREVLQKIEEKALKQPPVPFTSKIAKTAARSGWELRLLFQFLGYGYFSICLYRIANRLKADNCSMAWVPIYNVILMFNIAALENMWITILYLVCWGFVSFPVLVFTGVGGIITVVAALLYIVVITIFAWMRIAANMGKPAWLGILVSVPVINVFALGYLAFCDSREEMELV